MDTPDQTPAGRTQVGWGFWAVWVVALALGFSGAVGVAFGLVPAFKAAIIHPIDALRYE